MIIKINITDCEGQQRVIEAHSGFSLMEAAVQHDVKGINADCGGACACGTCHVHVAEAWRAAVGAPNELERDMLELASNILENSRLACQVRLTPELDGLEVIVP
jgi:2Fe-2S ferredoxin